ncbi:sensor domain-containing protein [Nocardiopsis sp. JB363]|uniref:sensor histidine kinase n=1 Tax=Nocardiopsis sp. JB363 TaxID=1434837 RepID=UPI000979FDE1|nr:sensor domain-containing protein [Nocardiopsis sp. JB363]SIO86385.1 putative two-component system sensor kinase [Nocardiopsis sp. JB363]
MSTPSPLPRTALEAMRSRGFLWSSWPWRSLGHLVGTLVTAPLAALVLFPFGMPLILLGERLEALALGEPQGAWTLAALSLFGAVLLLLGGPFVALLVAPVERWRLRLVHPPIDHGHRATGPGLWQRMRVRYTEAATWREFGYLLLLVLLLDGLTWSLLFLFPVMGAFLVVSPLIPLFGETVALGWWHFDDPLTALPLVAPGILLLLITPYVCTPAAGVHAMVARTLLSGRGETEELRSELVEVTRSRARLVDAFETERRRIERDLHDGAQQQLISLAMRLDLARMDAPAGSGMERALIQVHGQAKEIIGSLREIVHGIHPKVLSDRGLAAALPELADRSPVPSRVRVDLPRRPPPHLESAAYYVAAESLTNVAKHAEATEVRLNTRLEGDTLVLETIDDGRGGADPEGGTGLTGLADRVAVVGGRIWLSSPPGGPTRLRAEFPCPPFE